jgi:hypothetical protein
VEGVNRLHHRFESGVGRFVVKGSKFVATGAVFMPALRSSGARADENGDTHA